ncbi:MAG TPA: TonB family protein [Bacteroidota bacterium]|mgnify:CR=1 FL=1|nr:TonB family protein [Bacteroidota bacterium]
MAANSVDAKSWGISIGLHALLLLIMFFWAAFPSIRPMVREIELTVLDLPPAADATPERFTSRVRVQPTPTPRVTSAPRQAPQARMQQPAARQAPARETVSREAGRTQSAPSTPVQPRELRGGAEPVDFMDHGGGKQERSAAPITGGSTRRESREQGLATSAQSSDNVAGSGSGEGRAITSDPGTLSATPRSSTNIQWDGGVSRTRIAGSLPGFPAGATRDAQVAVRFRVRPDGSMYGMTVIQKGEPLYERAALNAMRGWKFNALPANVEQADQVGTATFHFKLK